MGSIPIVVDSPLESLRDISPSAVDALESNRFLRLLALRVVQVCCQLWAVSAMARRSAELLEARQILLALPMATTVASERL